MQAEPKPQAIAAMPVIATEPRPAGGRCGRSGSKAGNKRFYRAFIPRAEAIWKDYLDDAEA